MTKLVSALLCALTLCACEQDDRIDELLRQQQQTNNQLEHMERIRRSEDLFQEHKRQLEQFR